MRMWMNRRKMCRMPGMIQWRLWDFPCVTQELFPEKLRREGKMYVRDLTLTALAAYWGSIALTIRIMYQNAKKGFKTCSPFLPFHFNLNNNGAMGKKEKKPVNIIKLIKDNTTSA
ncbi:purple acid phosphatase 3 [Striga asiatica]|uniref:Purple acid phosphatase 3 n=1 Tax=Striga asiatica TaxID=4170 RepID=A0A5A7QK94_STRAF|nr:purple acid phosphatase 3 [Striga asiatica]